MPVITSRHARLGTTFSTWDFSSGDWSNWYGVQAGISITPANSPPGPPPSYEVLASAHGQTTASIVTSPARFVGGHTLKLTSVPAIADGSSHQNASAQNFGGDVAFGARTTPGDDTYYGFSQYLPSSNIGQYVDNDGDFNVFMEIQLAAIGLPVNMGIYTANSAGWSSANPSIYFEANVNNAGAYVSTLYRWIDPTGIQHDTWTDWVWRVKWAGDLSGLVTLWKNGVQVFNQTGIRTAFAGQTGSDTNLQLMNYHSSKNATIHHYAANFRIGSTFSAVSPALP